MAGKQKIEYAVGSKQRNSTKTAIEILTFLLFVVFMLPFVIVVLNSMRSNAEIINAPIGIPANLSTFFSNVKEVWNNPLFNFLAACRDSLIITILSLAVISIFSAMAAWVLVRNKTWWSNVLFMMYVAAMVIPFQSSVLLSKGTNKGSQTPPSVNSRV